MADDGSRTPAGGRTGPSATLVQKVAKLVGVVFLALGVLGFIPGITSNYGSMMFASHHSEAKLLGLFQVSILHNLVHCCSGWQGWSWLGPFVALRAT